MFGRICWAFAGASLARLCVPPAVFGPTQSLYIAVHHTVSMSGARYQPVTGAASVWPPAAVAAFTKRCPRPKKTANAEEQQRNNIDQNALVSIIEILMNDPDRILPTLGALQSSPEAPKRSGVSEEDEVWDETPSLRRIPAAWWVTWIIGASEGSLSHAKVRAIIEADGDKLIHLLVFALQLSPARQFPTACTNKRVCSRMLSSRATQLGDRLRGLDEHISANGVVKWGAGDCYHFSWNEHGVATECRHIGGKVVPLPQHVVITKAFKLIDNFSDLGANVALPLVTHVLHSLFPRDEGANRFIFPKGANDPLVPIAEACKANLDQQRVAATQGDIVENFTLLQEVKDNRKAVMTKRAREARCVNRGKKKMARTLDS